MHKSSKKTNIDLLKVDPELESEQIKNLKKIKESRDLEKVKEYFIRETENFSDFFSHLKQELEKFIK